MECHWRFEASSSAGGLQKHVYGPLAFKVSRVYITNYKDLLCLLCMCKCCAN